MKKLLLTVLLTSSVAVSAGNPSTMEEKKSLGGFIKAGGFSQLCSDLGWTMAWIKGETGMGCFSDKYARINGYKLVNGEWVK